MFNETELGFEHTTTTHFIFFGKKSCSLTDLQQTYPHFDFRSIRQTHSDILIQSTTGSELIEADAHWTTEKNIALIIRTADCIPALIVDQTTGVILAVHAGWRGVENQIARKSIQRTQLSEDLNVYIGPHIQQQSFACDLDIQARLDPNNKASIQKDNKFYVDLKHILLSQIHRPVSFELNVDTFTDLNFNSYRREKETANRNLSFIAKV